MLEKYNTLYKVNVNKSEHIRKIESTLKYIINQCCVFYNSKANSISLCGKYKSKVLKQFRDMKQDVIEMYSKFNWYQWYEDFSFKNKHLVKNMYKM